MEQSMYLPNSVIWQDLGKVKLSRKNLVPSKFFDLEDNFRETRTKIAGFVGRTVTLGYRQGVSFSSFNRDTSLACA